jgi:hypothetical protein
LNTEQSRKTAFLAHFENEAEVGNINRGLLSEVGREIELKKKNERSSLTLTKQESLIKAHEVKIS